MIKKLLGNLFGNGKTPGDEVAATKAPEVEISPGTREFNPFSLGLRDESMGGWFNLESGCIISDFNIEAEDIVLDVGCGDGGQANFCAQRGAHIILADIDQVKVAEAKRRLEKTGARRVEAVVSDSNPLPIEDETATKIISSEVIEHVDDAIALLGELYRTGKPGARYMISVPDPLAEHMQVGIAPEVYFQKPNHVRIIEHDEFDRMIENAGLIVEQRIPKGFYWNLWWLFYWICDQQLAPPWHPLLQQWSQTWDTLIKMEGGKEIKAALDKSLPRSQVIIARKPG